MSTYLAAVIIPSRGGANKLHYPLDALEKQTEKNFQVIVVLDGDIDQSAEVVERYIRRGSLNLSMIVFPENRGRVAALNAGHRAAEAEVLIRCDDDIEMGEDYIQKHVSYHSGSEEVGVMGLVHNLFPDTPHARAYGYYRDRKFREDAYKTAEKEHWRFWAANCSVTKTMFEAVGGYDERYKLYGWEDVDMGKMLSDAGVKMVLAQDLEVKHHIAATTTSARARRALYSGAARNVFTGKHGRQAISTTAPAGIWGVGVKFLSLLVTDRTVKISGNFIDKIADKVSPKIAEKLISLLVESAAYAGIHYPQRAHQKF